MLSPAKMWWKKGGFGAEMAKNAQKKAVLVFFQGKIGAVTKKMRNLRPICPGGEIGRRDSFRFYWIHVLVGSSPVPGTGNSPLTVSC